MTRTAMFGVALALAGCASRLGSPPPGRPAIAAPDDLVRRAEASELRGDHARASAYYEAALEAGAGEERVLPLLVRSLIRSGELRRSLAPISRLRDLRPGDRDLAALEETVRSLLAGGQPGGGEGEVRR